MNDFTYAWLVTAAITLVMVLIQSAVLEENPDGPIVLNGTNMYNRYYLDGTFDDTNLTEIMPDASSGQGGSTSDFTDEYRVTQSWFGSAFGKNIVGDTLSMPYNLMKSMGLPETISNSVGVFWWLLVIILTVLMILGKER